MCAKAILRTFILRAFMGSGLAWASVMHLAAMGRRSSQPRVCLGFSVWGPT